jgi:aminomethyltransferase
MSQTVGKRTALYEDHVGLGAKIVPFAGYLMPLTYSGQIAEHRAVRAGLGLFDLSHMGEFHLTGAGALAAAHRLVTNRILGTPEGQAVYSPMCREDGGIVDDLIVYHLPDSVLLVVNAANIDKDAAWIRERLPAGVDFRDASGETALIAVQGPDSERFLSPLADADLAAMDTYTARAGRVAGVPALVSRTGYTGEDGFELYVEAGRARALWARLREAGGDALAPVGLAARDTLRFEMGYCLYGNDIDETTTPLEAGLGWTVKLDDGDFTGRAALVRQKAEGVPRRLVGLAPESEKTIPRQGYAVWCGEETVGRVTSGTFAPSLGRGLAMGLVSAAAAAGDKELVIDVRGKRHPAAVTRMPFYTGGSRKTPPRNTPRKA